MFVDSHCHLTFFQDVEAVIKSALSKKVRKMINCPDETDFSKCISLAEKFAAVETCLGIYPVQAQSMQKEAAHAAFLEVESNLDKIIGIGEVGLDYKYGKTPSEQEKQKEIFIKQIHFAKENSLPLVVHSRFAERETLETLEKQKAENVLMHWYTNSPKLCRRAVDNGWFISVGPRVVNGEQTQKVVKTIPLEHLLLETDAPVPFEGKPAQPSWIPKVSMKVAELKETNSTEIEKITTKNAQKLFNF